METKTVPLDGSTATIRRMPMPVFAEYEQIKVELFGKAEQGKPEQGTDDADEKGAPDDFIGVHVRSPRASRFVEETVLPATVLKLEHGGETFERKTKRGSVVPCVSVNGDAGITAADLGYDRVWALFWAVLAYSMEPTATFRGGQASQADAEGADLETGDGVREDSERVAERPEP